VHDLCDELGLRCEVDITAGAARAWTNVKRKTDHDDELNFARLSSLGEFANRDSAANERAAAE
jgi:hypothetical protein